MRRHCGKVPDRGVAIAENVEWILFEMPHCNTSGWRSLKLVSKTRKHKANFWLGWNVSERRFSNCHDQQLLIENHPMAAQWIEQEMAKC